MDGNQIIQQVSNRPVGVADIVLLIDNTGSMEPCIDGLKQNIISNFVNVLEGTYTKNQQKVDWRARVVTYGDFEVDGPNWINLDNPFVNNSNDLKKQVESITLINGGDLPETLMDALYLVVRNTEWREKCHRFIVIFSDADMKNEMHEDIIDPNEAKDINHLKHLIISNKIKIYAILPEHQYYNDLLANLPSCNYLQIGKPGEEETYEGLKNQKFDDLLKQIAKTISQTSEVVVA